VSCAMRSSTGLECVILVGLPGAGKTTFYQTYFAATHEHISKDLWPNTRCREIRQQREMERLLAEGRSVVIDNTNPRVSDRAALIARAHAYNVRVIGYFFTVTTREAVARNAERVGRARVPNVAIFSAAKRLDSPTFEEGFDQLFRVEPTPNRGFTVREIAPPE
jgi:predicted kinase